MAKTFTFAILHFSVAFTITYLLTGSIVIGGAIALIEPAVNTVVFYFHDKVWKRIESRQTANAIKKNHQLYVSA
ncbi:DUF2061 domain-containing protein [Shewanella algidipiscicola]|uniref:Membrane protein n=1 Tax=Shewanella algidipiscicola TaxID=614070 RepID=A0ABQ4NTN2_9GAMM|nr:DUF2061 domain-containing protein [Shewanella algidipiscicola]GIU02742.1 membrane protein [Shewanella algidipiscicola]